MSSRLSGPYMLSYDLTHWLSFFLAALLLNISPGPDMAFILGHALRGGRRAGFAAMFGIWTGAGCHVLFAVAGISAVIAASAQLFAVMKWIGAAYLVWLGVGAFRGGCAMMRPEAGEQARLGVVFRRGVLIDLLNPKVAVFFLAFLPQFTEPEAGPVWLQLLVHGFLIIAVAALVEPALVLAAERLSRGLAANRRLSCWIERAMGLVFVGLGIRLALEER